MLTVKNRQGNLLELQAEGTLTRKDYDRVVPQLESALKGGRLRLLLRLEPDFRGWSPKGMVDELRFDLRHRDDFEKVAVVGEGALEKWAVGLSQPFFSGERRFFEDEERAREWLAAD